MASYQPPFHITSLIVDLCSRIYREIGHLEGSKAVFSSLKLRREQQIKTIQASLAIEGNTLSVEQITALLEGKRIMGPTKDIQEAQNALHTYGQIHLLNPLSMEDLLSAHRMMMRGLMNAPGRFRTTGVGIFKGSEVTHMAPPAKQLPRLMQQLFGYVQHPHKINFLILSCVFHYEFEFIHPFLDGNGRLGRLWQQLFLMRGHNLFQFLAIEEVVKRHQDEYYNVLSICDREGDSTQFIEFMLGAIYETLKDYRPDFKRFPKDAFSRLQYAQSKLFIPYFVRKDYHAIFPEISTATASRDLKMGVDQAILLRYNRLNQTHYSFNPAHQIK